MDRTLAGNDGRLRGLQSLLGGGSGFSRNPAGGIRPRVAVDSPGWHPFVRCRSRLGTHRPPQRRRAGRTFSYQPHSSFSPDARVRLRIRGSEPGCLFQAHKTSMGLIRSTPYLRDRQRRLPACAGADFPDRLGFVLAPSRWLERDPSGRAIFRSDPQPTRRRGVLGTAITRLVLTRTGDFKHTSRHRRCRLTAGPAGSLATTLLFHALGHHALTLRGRARFLQLPVGCAFDRGRLPRSVSLAMAIAPEFLRMRTSPTGAVSGRGAFIPPHVQLRGGEAHQRRPDLAQPDCARVPFFHPTPTQSARMVRATTPSRNPRSQLRTHVCHRTRTALRFFPTEKSPTPRSMVNHRPAGGNRAHRQLRLLQPPLDRPVPVPP